MGKENNNRFYEDFDRVNRELNQITNGPKKEQKAIDPKRKIFDGEHDPDPSDVFDKWERERGNYGDRKTGSTLADEYGATHPYGYRLYPFPNGNLGRTASIH